MAHMMSQQSGQDGRSVLGMLAVQVEKDPKTGTTVVRSVAPLSAPAEAAKTTTVFDDGRKSIHTVSGVESQPTNEELNQILSAIDGVGMKVLLEEVKVTPNNSEAKKEETKRPKEEKVLPATTSNFYSEKDFTQSKSSGSGKIEPETKVQKYATTVSKAEEKTMMKVKDPMEIKDDMVTSKPVTLLFLGYADETTDFEEENSGAITVERVLITEDGEEHVLGPQMPLQSLTQGAEPEAKEESKNNMLAPEDENAPGVKKGEKTKPKTCHCCSVM